MAGEVGLNKPMKSLPSVTSKHIQESNLHAIFSHPVPHSTHCILEFHMSTDPTPTAPDQTNKGTILEGVVLTQLKLRAYG